MPITVSLWIWIKRRKKKLRRMLQDFAQLIRGGTSSNQDCGIRVSSMYVYPASSQRENLTLTTPYHQHIIVFHWLFWARVCNNLKHLVIYSTDSTCFIAIQIHPTFSAALFKFNFNSINLINTWLSIPGTSARWRTKGEKF